MKTFELLEHPADIKLRFYGENLEQLFANAALGMMEFLFGEEVFTKTKITSHEKISIEADNVETLLVNWLSEILYLCNVKKSAYLHFSFEMIDTTKIIADVSSGKAVAEDDIKAVTYHELKIERINSGWVGDVVFDV